MKLNEQMMKFGWPLMNLIENEKKLTMKLLHSSLLLKDKFEVNKHKFELKSLKMNRKTYTIKFYEFMTKFWHLKCQQMYICSSDICSNDKC